MARCEDFPCCGHEMGCCPSYDADGNQLDMKCVCGASVPLHSHTSLCQSCLRGNNRMYDGEGDFDGDEDDYGMADPYGDYDSYGDYE